MKIVLLGAGRWGQNHLRVLRSLPVEVFVADLNRQRLNDCRALGVPDSHLSEDPRSFLAQADAAVVVTPAQSHFAICEEYLNSGKDVFVEKPMALSSLEAQVLVELAGKNKCILQVGHIFRYNAVSRWLYESIRQGKFGHINMMKGNFSGFKRPRNDTGVAFAQAIHFVDLFNYFLGRGPARVTAQLKDFLERGMEDEALLTMEYASDAGLTWAKVESGYHAPGKHREVLIIGTMLSAFCDFDLSPGKILLYHNQHVKEESGFKSLEGPAQQLNFSIEEPLLTELRAFLNCVETRTQPLANGHDGYESVRVLEAVMRSGKEGRSIELNDGGLKR